MPWEHARAPVHPRGRLQVGVDRETRLAAGILGHAGPVDDDREVDAQHAAADGEIGVVGDLELVDARAASLARRAVAHRQRRPERRQLGAFGRRVGRRRGQRPRRRPGAAGRRRRRELNLFPDGRPAVATGTRQHRRQHRGTPHTSHAALLCPRVRPAFAGVLRGLVEFLDNNSSGRIRQHRQRVRRRGPRDRWRGRETALTCEGLDPAPWRATGDEP